MYTALEAARFILAYSQEKGYGVSNLRLQKLLYLVQAYFLLKIRPLFPRKDGSVGFWPRSACRVWGIQPVRRL